MTGLSVFSDAMSMPANRSLPPTQQPEGGALRESGHISLGNCPHGSPSHLKLPRLHVLQSHWPLGPPPGISFLPIHPLQPCRPPALPTKPQAHFPSGPLHGALFCSLCQHHSSPGLPPVPPQHLLVNPHTAPAPRLPPALTISTMIAGCVFVPFLLLSQAPAAEGTLHGGGMGEQRQVCLVQSCLPYSEQCPTHSGYSTDLQGMNDGASGSHQGLGIQETRKWE